MSDELAELIQKNPLESLIFKAAQKQGMLTMEQEGILKVLRGQTTIEEVVRATEERIRIDYFNEVKILLI